MKFVKVAAAAAVVLVAAACGGTDKPSQASAPPAQDPAKLTVWMMGAGSPEQTAFLDSVEQEFKAKHPKTDVVVQYVPWPEAANRFTTALAGGEGPDVTEVGNTDVQSWVEQGAFADVSADLAKWSEGADLTKGALANDQREGKTYAVPWYGGVRGVWYRTDWFEELGITPPKTWDELAAAAKKIQDAKKVPGIGAPTDFTNGFASFVWGAGGDVAVEEGGKWVAKLDQPAAKEAIAFYTGLVTDTKVAPAKYAGKNELQGPQQDFALGKLGMYIDGHWAQPQLAKISPKNADKWSAFPIPSKDGATVAPAFAGGSDLAVWADSKAKAVAFDYITVLNSKKNAQTFADSLKFFPMYADLVNSPKYAQDPVLGGFAAAAANTKFLPTGKAWVEAEQNKKIIPTMLKEIMGGASVDEAVAKANADLNDALNAA